MAFKTFSPIAIATVDVNNALNAAPPVGGNSSPYRSGDRATFGPRPTLVRVPWTNGERNGEYYAVEPLNVVHADGTPVPPPNNGHHYISLSSFVDKESTFVTVDNVTLTVSGRFRRGTTAATIYGGLANATLTFAETAGIREKDGSRIRCRVTAWQ